MKTLLTWVKDILLFLMVMVFLLVGLWGVTLPFRSVFAESGPYQLQAFDNGLAFFHYGRGETPFWNVTPLNDFVVDQEGVRSAHLAVEAWDNKQFEATYKLAKPEGIFEAVRAYLGQVTPWYRLKTGELEAYYQTQAVPEGWLIQKKVTFNEPRYISQDGITLWYYSQDVVFDAATLQTYTLADKKTLEEIKARYGYELVAMTQEDWTRVLTSGQVKIINPSRPGVLTVTAQAGQDLWVNRTYRMVEAVKPVEQQVKTVESAILVQGSETMEAK